LTPILGPTEAPFGVVVAARPEHLHWARGTCASVRHFMGDTPICLLLDGDASVDDFEAFGVRVVRAAEIEHPVLRRLSGTIRVKHAGLWVAPFDAFLFADADAIVWGDLRPAGYEGFDFVLDAPLGSTKSKRSVMDPAAVRRHFPDFDVHRHQPSFVNTGAYIARRGTLSLDRYLELVRFSWRHRDVFESDQGIFNFLVFSGADEGTLRVDQRELQVKVDDVTPAMLQQRFRFVEGQPDPAGGPVVIHWCGTPKPTMRPGPDDFFEPMAFFRREFLHSVKGRTSTARADLRLRLEDMLSTDFRGSNVRGRVIRVRRRAARWTRYGVDRAKIAILRRSPPSIATRLRGRSRSRAGPPA
jgi:hypothetical protein